MVQEKARELAIIETLDGGKPIRESRDFDVPTAANHFFYYAGWADKLEYAFPNRKTAALGVAGQIIPWNFPLLMAAWKIAPALATGNTVVLKPAETTPLTALKLAEIIQESGNLANPDMVGHTGDLAAAVRAAEAVDAAIGDITDAVRAVHGALVVTADHGNLEMMRDPATGQPHTAHTVGPVPLVYVGEREGVRLRSGGALRDVAPTLLDLMQLPAPAAMTGRSLFAG